MDEMKIRTKFLKSIVSKVIGNLVKKKLGRNIDIRLNDFQIEIDDTARVHLSIDAKMTKEEFEMLLVKQLGL